jgi:hypothetical protein
MMTHAELLAKFDEKVLQMRRILETKGQDYSPADDALCNFTDFGWRGIVVRLGDKYQRLKNFAKFTLCQPNHESVEDTLLDNANYSILALIVKEDEENEGDHKNS